MTLGQEFNADSQASTATSLLVRVRARDPQAWQRLVDLYGPLVYHWCRNQGLRAEDSSDVFQEVFTAVSKSVDRFIRRPGNGTFRGWLWTITRNKILDFHRKQSNRITATGGTHAHLRLAEIAEPLDDSLDDSQISETVNLFHRALEMVRGEFEPRTWQAFWRATVDGDPTSEIAADMGITANGVRQAKFRVLRRLRQQLGDVD